MSPQLLHLDDQGFVRLAGEPLDLPPRERAVLTLLMRQFPAVVTKDEFAQRAWSGGEMTDANLARRISNLRAALGDACDLDIESVYGQGYRLRRRDATGAGPASELDPATSDTYHHARELARHRTRGSVLRAIDLLREVVGRAPLHVPARIALAEQLGAAVFLGILDSAPALDEGFAVLSASGDVGAPVLCARAHLLDLGWRWHEADALFSEALARHADDAAAAAAYGRHLLLLGRAPQAEHWFRRALSREPTSALLKSALAAALIHQRRFDEGLALAAQAQADHPEHRALEVFHLAVHALVNPVPALLEPARVLADGRQPPPYARPTLAYVLARIGRLDEARAVVDAGLAEPGSTIGGRLLFTPVLWTLGDVDAALALLAQGHAARAGSLPNVLRDPTMETPRSHAAVRALLEAVFGDLA